MAPSPQRRNFANVSWRAEATPAGQRQGKAGTLEAARRWSPPGPSLFRSPGLPRKSFTRFSKYVCDIPMQLKTQLERTEAILEDEQTQRQKLMAEFEEVRPYPGGPEPLAVSGMVGNVAQTGGCGSGSGGCLPRQWCCTVGHLPPVHSVVPSCWVLSHFQAGKLGLWGQNPCPDPAAPSLPRLRTQRVGYRKSWRSFIPAPSSLQKQRWPRS